MESVENTLEMDQLKINDDENAPLRKDIAILSNGTDATSIKIDHGANKTGQPTTCLEDELYRLIFSIVRPYVFIGSPVNYCFGKARNNPLWLTTSRCMKIYTWCISIFAHLILCFWLCRLALSMWTQTHLSPELIKDLFILCYIVAGLVALDIIWFHRGSLMEVLSNLLDYRPLAEDAKNRALFTDNVCTLKYYRFKFCLLRVLSHLLAALLLVYYAFLAFSIIQAYTDTNPEGYTHWWDRTLEIITIYAFFFFLASLFLLLSLVWATQYKIKHLNLYIGNLISSNEQPDLSDIGVVKAWYQNILQTVKSIDRVFSLYILAYIGFFFLGIIYFVGQVLDLFKHGNGRAENVQFITLLALAFLMALILFYGLKEFTDVHEHSITTRSMLYDYVLNTKPEDRTTKFFMEVDFMTQGLLSKAATFTLLGQIELNKSFMAHLAVIIYSYAVLFHQFIQKPK